MSGDTGHNNSLEINVNATACDPESESDHKDILSEAWQQGEQTLLNIGTHEHREPVDANKYQMKHSTIESEDGNTDDHHGTEAEGEMDETEINEEISVPSELPEFGKDFLFLKAYSHLFSAGGGGRNLFFCMVNNYQRQQGMMLGSIVSSNSILDGSKDGENDCMDGC